MFSDGKEKRRYPRPEVHCKVFVYKDSSNIISSYTEDISEGGLRAVFDERLKLSSVVDMEIFLQDEPIKCKGKITWVKEVKDAKQPEAVFYDTGIEFLQEPV